MTAVGRVPWVRVCAVAALACGIAIGQHPPARDGLDQARVALLELRFEDALAVLDALLGREIVEDERVEALVLKTQANVALGNWRSVEDGYEAILRLRPAFEPDPALTPSKAMERFRKLRARLIGTLDVRARPPDVAVFVDGRELARTTGPAPVVAGRHAVRVARRGFDAAEREVDVAADGTTTVEIELVPNARTVIVQTIEDGVEVEVDGKPAGRTARPARPAGGPPPPPQVTIEYLSLGAHTFVLRKPCFRTERIERALAVDLLRMSPDVLGPVELRPARADLIVRGDPAGAGVSVDGDPGGEVPTRPILVCPGERRVSIVHLGRRVWVSDESVQHGDERLIDVFPRPNALFVGTERWPEELGRNAPMFNEPETRPAPGGWDPADAAAWERLGLASDVDLAVGVARGRRGDDATFVYSPALRRVARLAPGVVWEPERPAWGRWLWGLATADSRIGGPALVVHVGSGSAAAKAGIAPGDRVVAVGGTSVQSAGDVREALARAQWDAAVDVTWRSPAGVENSRSLAAEWSPSLLDPPASVEGAMLRAAWAAVDAATSPGRAPAALANLAMLQSEHGDHARAIETLRRARFPERAGFGQGSVDYLLGDELLAAGRETEAVESFRRAAAGASTARDDEGPSIASAARQRLAELGAR